MLSVLNRAKELQEVEDLSEKNIFDFFNTANFKIVIYIFEVCIFISPVAPKNDADTTTLASQFRAVASAMALPLSAAGKISAEQHPRDGPEAERVRAHEGDERGERHVPQPGRDLARRGTLVALEVKVHGLVGARDEEVLVLHEGGGLREVLRGRGLRRVVVVLLCCIDDGLVDACDGDVVEIFCGIVVAVRVLLRGIINGFDSCGPPWRYYTSLWQL